MKVKCDIWRFDAEADVKSRTDTYVLDVEPTETVLGALVKINHEFDASLAFRFACGVVKCGECAVEVNGYPCLACEKLVEEEMKIKPLSGLPIIKDLVIDRRSVFEQIMKLSPELSRLKRGAELRNLGTADADKFVRMTKCFECLMCQSSCPVHAEEQERFVGPLGILWLGQMSLDPGNRLVLKDEIEAALNLCARCGLCSDACACAEDIIGLAMDTLEKS